MQQTRSAIGVDIGDHAVKLVQLERDGGRLKVGEICHVRVGEAAGAGEDRVARRRRVLEAGKQALRIGDFRGRKCLSSLRLFETTTRHVRIGVEESEQVSEALARELREGDSESSEDLSCQYQQVAELVEHGQRQCEYLCCIADPLIIRDHLELLDAMRLDPVAIDLDACAQVRPFVRHAAKDDDAMSVTVDLGCRCSRLVVVRAAHPIVMRTVPIGGAHFLRTLEDKLQLDFRTTRDLAEACRNSSSAELDDLKLAVSRTLSRELDLIVGRVQECARYAATLFRGQAIDSLRVVGGASALPGVVDYLARNLGVAVVDNDPFRAMGLEMPAASRSVAPATFATALGLAVRGLAA